MMEMPIRSFWSANANVSRLSAERDMRLAQVFATSQGGGEALKQLGDSLREEQRQPIVTVDKRRDANATRKLKEALRT